MMDTRDLGLLIIALGAGLILIGLLVWAGGFSWFGKLPGDLRWEGERGSVYVPITSMILISIGLSLLLALIRRLL